MQTIKKYYKYILVPFIPLFIVVVSYILKALFNVGVFIGTLVRIVANLL